MPRPPRDERRAQLARTGRQWGQWLRTAMTESAIDVKTLVERTQREGANFDRSNVSKWRAGDNTADPANVVIIAKVLGRDRAEALRAAGHDIIADVVVPARDNLEALEPLIAEARAILEPLTPAERAAFTQDLLKEIREMGRRTEKKTAPVRGGDNGKNGGRSAS